MAEAPGGRPLDAAGLLEFPWFSAASAAAVAATAAATAAAPATVVTAAITVAAVTAVTAAALAATDAFSGPLLPVPLSAASVAIEPQLPSPSVPSALVAVGCSCGNDWAPMEEGWGLCWGEELCV